MYGKVEGTEFVELDPQFRECVVGHARVERLWTGGRWLEGPAWFNQGRYVLFSDIPNNRMLRWDEASDSVQVFKNDSNNSNGNTVDAQGRLISCEHLTRRVVRTEHDGSTTVLADSYNGKRLNSPNDVVSHSDGSTWFTDPDYGILSDYEGKKAEPELPCQVYRIDTNGRIEALISDMSKPNGLAFSPDESKLYVADTGASHDEHGPKHIVQYTLENNNTAVVNAGVFAVCDSGLFDGFRLDNEGRIWTSAADGVHCYSPDGVLLGKILIPEFVANVTFGGIKRNRLFICGTTSLYSVYVTANGCAYG